MLYELRNVFLEYRLNKKAIYILKGVQLEVKEGEFLALMGPSGSGKSTLLNIISGFLLPTKGDLFYRGRNLYSLSSIERARYRNKEIGMVHQFFNLLPEFTALQNVAVPLLIFGSSWKQAAEEASSMLERVRILTRARHYPSELSGGEQQRVAIARALVNKPSVIIADEPTGNLDQATTKEILELLSEIHQENPETTFIAATHDPIVAERGTRIVEMSSLAKDNMQHL